MFRARRPAAQGVIVCPNASNEHRKRNAFLALPVLMACAVFVQVTLQYCLWDQFKEVSTAPPRRAANLARFLAIVIANFGLSISLFKVPTPAAGVVPYLK